MPEWLLPTVLCVIAAGELAGGVLLLRSASFLNRVGVEERCNAAIADIRAQVSKVRSDFAQVQLDVAETLESAVEEREKASVYKARARKAEKRAEEQPAQQDPEQVLTGLRRHAMSRLGSGGV